MNMNRPVPLLDVPRGNAPLREEFLEALANVLDSGRFLFGPDVKSSKKNVLAGLTRDLELDVHLVAMRYSCH